MLSYFFKCRQNTESKNLKVVKTKNGRITFYQNVQYVIVKNQKLSKSRLLSSLGIKTPPGEITLVGPLLF